MAVLGAIVVVLFTGCHPVGLPLDLAAAPTAPVWPAEPNAPWVAFVGSLVPQNNDFQRVIDVACTEQHLLAIADVDAGLVSTVDLREGRWRRTRVADRLELVSPVGVSFLSDGRLALVDSELASVFVSTGPWKRLEFDRLQSSEYFVRPTAVEELAKGGIVVVDTGGHRLVEIRGASSSKERGARGEKGIGFNFPVDVAEGHDGALYVSDALNAVIQRVTVTGEGSDLVEQWTTRGEMVRPKGIAVDPAGYVHVVDAAMQHVQVFGEDGTPVTRYGHPGQGEGELSLPAGICIDPHGHIFVADSLNQRVQVYELLGGR